MWTFDSEGRWAEAVHPLDANFEGNLNDQLTTFGFELFTQQGDANGEHLEVYTGPGPEFLIILNTFHTWREVLCLNFPAMLEFMRRYGQQWSAGGFLEYLREHVSELHTLLLDDRTGIFRHEVQEHNQRRHDERLRWKRQKA